MFKGLEKLLFVFFLIAFPFLGFSSTYQPIRTKTILVASFEGKSVKVSIKLDDINNRLIIKIGHSDSLYIDGYVGDDRYEKIKIISQKFLLLSFAVRGGSGLGLSETL